MKAKLDLKRYGSGTACGSGIPGLGSRRYHASRRRTKSARPKNLYDSADSLMILNVAKISSTSALIMMLADWALSKNSLNLAPELASNI